MTPSEDISALFVGTWSLVSWTATSLDGQIEYPFGEDAQGRILYDRDGHMAAHLMRRQRTPFTSENPLDSTMEECQASYREYFSYYGSYTIQQDKKTITHHVEAASFPNWVGKDQVRNFSFSGDSLALSLANTDGSIHTLVWKRQ